MNLEYLHLYLRFFPTWTVRIWWIINDQLGDVSNKKLNEYMLINLLVSLLFLVFLDYSVYIYSSPPISLSYIIFLLSLSVTIKYETREGLTIGNEFQLIHVIFVFFFLFFVRKNCSCYDLMRRMCQFCRPQLNSTCLITDISTPMSKILGEKPRFYLSGLPKLYFLILCILIIPIPSSLVDSFPPRRCRGDRWRKKAIPEPEPSDDIPLSL